MTLTRVKNLEGYKPSVHTKYSLLSPTKYNLIYRLVGPYRVFIHLTDNPQSFRRAAFGYASSSVPILLDDMKCLGNETSLIGCSFRKPIGSHNCYHAEDAGVRCKYACEIDTLLHNCVRV